MAKHTPALPDFAEPSATALSLCAGGGMTISRACEFAGISRRQLYRHIAAGELAYSKIGRRVVIPREAVVRLLASRLRGAGGVREEEHDKAS